MPNLALTDPVDNCTETKGSLPSPIELVALLKRARQLMLDQQDIRDQWQSILTAMVTRNLGASGVDVREVDVLDTQSAGWCARTIRGNDLKATRFRIHAWRLRTDSYSIAHPLSAVWEAEAEPMTAEGPSGHRCTMLGYVFPSACGADSADPVEVLGMALAA